VRFGALALASEMRFTKLVRELFGENERDRESIRHSDRQDAHIVGAAFNLKFAQRISNSQCRVVAYALDGAHSHSRQRHQQGRHCFYRKNDPKPATSDIVDDDLIPLPSVAVSKLMSLPISISFRHHARLYEGAYRVVRAVALASSL
jgi:hypothetical protein